MATRTVRLDETDEARLRRLRDRTGQSTSEILKRGLRELERGHSGEGHAAAWDIYRRLDLGAGGYASGAAADSRRAAREAITERHRRSHG
jgi:Arc/MetJ-type ribon-helix-helix transcriptional regulator